MALIESIETSFGEHLNRPKKVHRVGLDKITRPKAKGRLGLQSARAGTLLCYLS